MKKLLIVIAILLLTSPCFAAVWTAAAGGGNWNNAATWEEGGGFPVAGDTANLDAGSGNVTINVASACAIVDCTGYTGTLTHSAEMTTTGNVTFVAGMTLTSTSTWIMDTGGQTFIPAGKTLYNFTLLANDHIHMTTSDLVIANNFTNPAGSDIMGGRTITMTGASGTIVDSGAKNDINLTLDPGAGGTITLALPSGSTALAFGHNAGASYTLTLTSGSFDTSPAMGYYFTMYDSVTITGISSLWLEPLIKASCTLTLNQDTTFLYWNTTIQDTRTLTVVGNLHLQWNIRLQGSGSLSGGTIYWEPFLGDSAWTQGTGTVSSNIIIDPTLPNTCTLSTNASTSGNMTIYAGKSVILSTGSTHACANFNATGTSGSHITLYSNNPGTKAIFNVTTPQTVTYVDATDIDSSGGSPITTTGGSVTNCLNWSYVVPPSNGLFYGTDF